MKVREVMTADVELAKPDDSVQHAAQVMASIDAGVLPVSDGDRLIGMITDRDIAVRAVAPGKDASSTKVRDIMSPEIKYCFDDEDVDHVADNMAEQQLRRMPVVNREKRLVGIVSLADIATEHGPTKAGDALCGISREGGQHTQAGAFAGSKPGM